MITVAEVLDGIADALQADSSITTWVATNYPTKTLQVFIGEDVNNPYGENQAPCFIVNPSGADYSDNGYRTFTVDVDWLIVQDGVDTSVSNRRTITGLLHADELGQLAFAAIRAKWPTTVIARADYFVEATMRFPLCQGGMTVTLQIPKPLGYEPTL